MFFFLKGGEQGKDVERRIMNCLKDGIKEFHDLENSSKRKSLSKDLEQECLLFVLSVCKQYPYLAVIEMTSWISQPESYHTLYFSFSCAVSQISFLILRGFEVSGKHVRSSFAHDPCSVFMSLTRFICVPVQEISE